MNLLLDTHAALWLNSGDERLKPRTRELIDRVRADGGDVYFSAVSAWEVAQLVERGRIELDVSPAAWIARFLSKPGLLEVALTSRAAVLAYDLPDFDHRDPADRLLIATAIELDCPLVSYDGPISAYAEGSGRRLGLRVQDRVLV